MASTIQNTGATQGGLRLRLTELAADFRARQARNRVFRQTMSELTQLTDRELSDLGIHRTQIRGIARDAAYKA